MICFFGYVGAMEQYEEARNAEARIYFRDLPGLTEEGRISINAYLLEVGRNLSVDDRRRIYSYALRGIQDPHPYLYKFWGTIASITGPLTELCMLACAVIPMLSIENDENGKLSKTVTSILAMSSIIFGKIHGYAEIEKKDLENLRMFLQAIATEIEHNP
jgi:hypothetical protein